MKPFLALRGWRWAPGFLAAGIVSAAAAIPDAGLFPPPPLVKPALPAIVTPRDPAWLAPEWEAVTLPELPARWAEGVVAASVAPPSTRQVPPELHEEFVAFVRRFEATLARSSGIEARADAAMAALRSGRTEEAITALLAIDASQPGWAGTALRLGLVHELAGRWDEAVVWVARASEREAGAPGDTAWLHLAILQAKRQLRADPQWLRTHGVLGVDAGGRPVEEVLRAIELQLAARSPLVPPTDAVMCELYYQAALRVTGRGRDARREHYLRESLRYGEGRKAEIAALRRT
jgi:hypothetical protein